MTTRRTTLRPSVDEKLDIIHTEIHKLMMVGQAGERFQTAVLNKLELIISKPDAYERTLKGILCTLENLNQRITTMFEELEASVAKLTSASNSAEALLDGIKAKLDELIANGGLNAADKAKVAEIAAAIGKEGDDLAQAVVRNTAAEGEEPVDPPV